MPVELSVDVRFAVSVPRTPQIMAWMRTAMQSATAKVLGRGQVNLSGRFLRVRSGKGIGSLRSSVRVTRDEVVGKVGSPAFYLRILHQGFPAQQLTTRKKGFAFFSGGNLIRTKTIHHPGVTARPWLQTAAEESREDIVAAFDQVAVNIGRFFSGGNARAA